MKTIIRASASLLVFTFVVSLLSCYQKEKTARDEWYIPTEDKNANLYITEFGKGDPVVLLHGGWGAEHSYLLDACQGLEDHYRFVLYDQRGSLRSPCPEDQISVEKHIEDLDKVRKELGLERMTLIGHSMGTFLAMSYLEKYPQRVKDLILLGALPARTPVNDSDKALAAEQKKATKEFFDRPEIEVELKKQGLDKNDEDKTAKEITHSWRIRFAGVNLYHVERWPMMKGGRVFYNSKAGQAAGKTTPESWDFTKPFGDHPYPISIILGDHDYVDMGGRKHKSVIGDIPNVELVLIENAGHAAWIDQPEKFRKILRAALEKY